MCFFFSPFLTRNLEFIYFEKTTNKSSCFIFRKVNLRIETSEKNTSFIINIKTIIFFILENSLKNFRMVIILNNISFFSRFCSNWWKCGEIKVLFKTHQQDNMATSPNVFLSVWDYLLKTKRKVGNKVCTRYSSQKTVLYWGLFSSYISLLINFYDPFIIP